MATPPTPPPPATPPPSSREQLEILSFLREELQKNRDALRDESEAVRNLFTKTASIAAIPLSIAILIAGFFWFHSLADLKQAAVQQAQSEADLEVKAKLREEFSTDRIRETIRTAAEDAAQKEARPLIQQGVDAELRSNSGVFRSIAAETAKEKVNQAVAPLIAAEKDSLTVLHVQGLIAKAEEDDAEAFDELLAQSKNAPPSTKDVIDVALSKLENDFNVSTPQWGMIGSGECPSPDNSQFRGSTLACASQILEDSQGARVSEQKVRDGIARLLGMGPEIVKVALHDPSLAVRAQAVRTLNGIYRFGPGVPAQGFDLLDIRDLNSWWNINEPYQEAIALVSFERAGYFTDEAFIYDKLQTIKKEVPAPLRQFIVEAISRMKDQAAKSGLTSAHPEFKKDIEQELGWRSCADAETGTKAVSNQFLAEQDEQANGSASLALLYLQQCPADLDLVPVIADYAVHTRHLSSRYGAVVIVNGWLHTQIDPFEADSIKEWWTNNRTRFRN